VRTRPSIWIKGEDVPRRPASEVGGRYWLLAVNGLCSGSDKRRDNTFEMVANGRKASNPAQPERTDARSKSRDQAFSQDAEAAPLTG
jgi:hypothetical protein